ncbi:BH0509 family protein [Guptibacillus algicola]|nr:BH0509 family protein [Alkalihalobacillus algicola]MCA0986923.1 BH0509 family protein [Alkalihalobacillus algicola]
MSQKARNQFIERLTTKTTMNRDDVLSMSDAEIEYFHWLYFDESPMDLM